MLPSFGESPKSAIDAWLSELNRPVKTIVFVDIVESVRLMEEHEQSVIRRWLHLVSRVEAEVLPAHGGRLVKSTGDGLMLEFAEPREAVQSALLIQAIAREEAAAMQGEEALTLRAGIHATPVVADVRDVYGKGVNLAARLMSLAGPGEIVVSSDVRSALVADLDADIEDLGECYLKHVAQPVRSYRVAMPNQENPAEGPTLAPDRNPLTPSIAVIPFLERADNPTYHVLGQVLADQLIATISKSSLWHVVSRLSTSPFQSRAQELQSISSTLNVRYVLSGHFTVVNNRVMLIAELADAMTSAVVWSDVLHGDLAGIILGDDALVSNLVSEVGVAVTQQEMQAVRFASLPTLASHSLLFGAIGLMHRASRHDFSRAQEALDHLVSRHPRAATPYAWSAMWNVLRVTRGWVSNTPEHAQQTLGLVGRAMDLDPQCSLALAMAGFVHCHLRKDINQAQTTLSQALTLNPNESLAWLFSSVCHAFKGEGAQAMPAAEHAARLSPLDPLKYYYDSLAATAALSLGDYLKAHALATRSLRANKAHSSTLRALAVSSVMLGDVDGARAHTAHLLALEPGFSIKSFLSRSPSDGYAIASEWAKALRIAGAPES